MKLFLRLSFAIITAFVFTGCSKVALIDNEPLAGSWVLTEAAHKDSWGWYPVTTGVERGVFYFYNNGTARYSEPG